MGRLPGMAYSSGITRSQQVQFGGLRHHPNAGDGEIYDMENMSARDYPLLRSRDKRRNGGTLVGATEMFFDNHAMWYTDSDGWLWYKRALLNIKVAYVGAGEIKFVRFGDRIVLMPAKKLVQAKYLFALILFAAITVLGVLGGFGMTAALGAKSEIGYGEVVVSTLSISCIYLMTAVVVLPCNYKFGVEKSRFLFVAIYLIIFACFALLFSIDHMKQWLLNLGAREFMTGVAVFGVLTLLGMIFSYRISVRIMENKEW